jgi:predicted nucleic acid-binding Zn ribbon protein
MPPKRMAGRGAEESAVSLGAALRPILRETGLRAKSKREELEATWSRVVGDEIARHTRVMGFSKGVLNVGVGSSSLMSDIQFHRAALLADMRREIARPVISEISFSLVQIKQDDGRSE